MERLHARASARGPGGDGAAALLSSTKPPTSSRALSSPSHLSQTMAFWRTIPAPDIGKAIVPIERPKPPKPIRKRTSVFGLLTLTGKSDSRSKKEDDEDGGPVGLILADLFDPVVEGAREVEEPEPVAYESRPYDSRPAHGGEAQLERDLTDDFDPFSPTRERTPAPLATRPPPTRTPESSFLAAPTPPRAQSPSHTYTERKYYQHSSSLTILEGGQRRSRRPGPPRRVSFQDEISIAEFDFDLDPPSTLRRPKSVPPAHHNLERPYPFESSSLSNASRKGQAARQIRGPRPPPTPSFQPPPAPAQVNTTLVPRSPSPMPAPPRNAPAPSSAAPRRRDTAPPPRALPSPRPLPSIRYQSISTPM